jgi:hypothetical protein
MRRRKWSFHNSWIAIRASPGGATTRYASRGISLQGRHAHELFATILEAGMPGEGAAGTIYEALHNLTCTIDPPTIAGNSGAGADCTFDPGPP